MSEYEMVLVRRKTLIDRGLIDGKKRRAMPEYNIWAGMLARCRNPNTARYESYGGRGITVCDAWQKDFAVFYRDMGPRPSIKHSIDRIDNDGNYEPGNCRWATPDVQALNKRQGGRSDAWTAEDVGVLTKMWREFYAIEDIASVLKRTPQTVRLRAHTTGLRRDASLTKLSKKHADLAVILRERGPDAFLAALDEKTKRQKQEKALRTAQKAAAKANIVTEIVARQISRNEKMRALRLAGCDLAEIGRLLGVTRERVRQLQLVNFNQGDEGQRKVNATKPEHRNRHIDRLIAAWNRASVEARLAFLETANEDPRAKIPTLGTRSKRQFRDHAGAMA